MFNNEADPLRVIIKRWGVAGADWVREDVDSWEVTEVVNLSRGPAGPGFHSAGKQTNHDADSVP